MEYEVDVFYNRFWRPILRQLNDWRLVWFNWFNYLFIVQNAVYNYNWEHVWWIEWGLIRDLFWHVYAFWENVTDYPKPFLPFKQFKPFPLFVQFEPIRPVLWPKNIKPLKNFLWSGENLIKDGNYV